MTYKLFWTDEAIDNLEEILDYLIQNWSQKEVDNFKFKLKKHLGLISRFPLMFPVSNYNPRLRKAVLSKQTTVYFEIKDGMIYIAYIFVNKKDINRIKD
jgi:plasmid stabilization system protein ParE